MDERMTFTVADVQVARTGERADGSTWTKYLIKTTDGELLGTFQQRVAARGQRHLHHAGAVDGVERQNLS
jgi:hypothetical protein